MICRRYKCVFIHIPKNAGQSIEHVFLKLMGLNWKKRASLLLRYNDKPELGPPRLAHLKAHEYVLYNYMTQEQFDIYFKFSVVRNPWDRAISMYKYFGYATKCDFKSFLKGAFLKEKWTKKYWFVGPQNEFIYDTDGKRNVNFIAKFENLEDDFRYVCQQIGLPNIKVPHINSSEKKTEKSGSKMKDFVKYFLQNKSRSFPQFKRYQDYYDNESREMVAELYKADIEIFGYQFEEETQGKNA